MTQGAASGHNISATGEASADALISNALVSGGLAGDGLWTPSKALETVGAMTGSPVDRSAIATGDDSNSASGGIILRTPVGTNLRLQGSALTPAKPAPTEYEAAFPPLSTANKPAVSSGRGSAPLVDLSSRPLPPVSVMDNLMDLCKF